MNNEIIVLESPHREIISNFEVADHMSNADTYSGYIMGIGAVVSDTNSDVGEFIMQMGCASIDNVNSIFTKYDEPDEIWMKS